MVWVRTAPTGGWSVTAIQPRGCAALHPGLFSFPPYREELRLRATRGARRIERVDGSRGQADSAIATDSQAPADCTIAADSRGQADCTIAADSRGQADCTSGRLSASC